MAKRLPAEYSDTVAEYLEYLEYLASVRSDFSDEAVLSFDEEFRQAVENGAPSLFDSQKKRPFPLSVLKPVQSRLLSHKNQKTLLLFFGQAPSKEFATNIPAVTIGRKISVSNLPESVCLNTCVDTAAQNYIKDTYARRASLELVPRRIVLSG